MILHNPRSEQDRSPFGALPAGTPCRLRLRMSRRFGAVSAAVYFWYDDEPESPVFVPMTRGEDDADGRMTFFAAWAPPRPGLSFYRFEIKTGAGDTLTVAKDGPAGAKLAFRDATPFQLTVYDPSFETPSRFKGRVMYQIFPDRFCRSGDIQNTVWPQRNLRDDWGGVPKYLPDPDGEYRPDDWFGGDLRGIKNSLPYLNSLGVGLLYLNPIFEAHSNHRYDTADYFAIDPLLGDERDFADLCREAAKWDILILFDGVFSHTGADSRYFNADGRYGERVGAARNPLSREARWYRFVRYPTEWKGWWGVRTLPEVYEERESWMRFVTGPDGVVDHWLSSGAAGVRLDVADELPDVFLDRLRRETKRRHPDALILGEVWEDASNKVSYGKRRRYLLGDQLDGVMNYPFRDAVIEFIREGDGGRFFDRVMTVCEHYPKPALDVSMNPLSTHDTARILTELANEPGEGQDRAWQASRDLTGAAYERGVALASLAYALVWFLPGLPCVYYGDEIGMQGYRDPFCRGCFVPGQKDDRLLALIRRLGALTASHPLLADAPFAPLYADRDAVVYERRGADGSLLCGVSRSGEPLALPGLGGCIPLWGRYEQGVLYFDSPGVWIADLSRKEG